jgi:hypothetical protein
MLINSEKLPVIIGCERIGQMSSKPNETQLRMVELLKRRPGGMTCGQLRRELEREGFKPMSRLILIDGTAIYRSSTGSKKPE